MMMVNLCAVADTTYITCRSTEAKDFA